MSLAPAAWQSTSCALSCSRSGSLAGHRVRSSRRGEAAFLELLPVPLRYTYPKREAGGPSPIGVKLASYGIADIRLSFASGVGEASMRVGGGLQEVMESDAADDGDQQHTSGDVPHAPERRGISSVEQVLRGRRPGNPGRGRRTTRPG